MAAEKEKNWKEEKGKTIIDALADDGVTYGEAQAIIKAAEWELGKRRYEDKLKKRIKPSGGLHSSS